MSRAVMEGFHPRRPFGGFRHRDRCPMGTPMPSGSGGGAVRVHPTMDGKDTPASSRRMPAPEGGAGDREARRNVCVQCESNGLATKRRFGQIRHGVEWRPAMFRVASVSVKCGRGGGPDLASIGDDDIPYIYLNN